MLKITDRKTHIGPFNMTPIIDIVFLLIIFFMLVCQFIVAENFQVAVPDNISSAQPPESAGDKTTTVTVMFDENSVPTYAVGSRIISASTGPEITAAIAAAVDTHMQNLPIDKRVVSLRTDKKIPFGNAKYALAGIGQSSATDIKWAVNKQKQK
jgi:biopolymer transport protein ExbD